MPGRFIFKKFRGGLLNLARFVYVSADPRDLTHHFLTIVAQIPENSECETLNYEIDFAL